MNTKTSIASIIYSLKKLDQQRHFKIADKIFNNLRIAQEESEKVLPKTFFDFLETSSKNIYFKNEASCKL